MIINHLILYHHRWAIPIIAQIHKNNGAKYIFLHKSLQISKAVLSDTLPILIEAGYIQKNPGYGHPLRPEYIISPSGKLIANQCLDLYESLKKEGLESLISSKWCLPLILVIAKDRKRFSEIKEDIKTLTSRSLSYTLKKLENEKIVIRTVIPDHPPVTYYRLAQNMISILPKLLQFNDTQFHLSE